MESIAFGNVALILISTVIVLGLSSSFAIYLGRKTKSSADWDVGGRSLPLYVVVGSLYATAVGGGVLVAHVGIGYRGGWSILSYGLLIAIALTFFCVLAPWLRKQNFTTLPDVFEKIYGDNKALKAALALACIVVPFGWIATQIVAFAKIFAAITGISMVPLMVFIAVVGVLFVMPAGLTSVAWTDFVFGCFMIAVSIFAAVFALDLAGGWSAVLAKVPERLTAFPESMGAVGTLTLFLWTLSILPGTMTNQLYYQRIFAAKNVDKVRLTLVIAILVMFSSKIWSGYMGIVIHALNPGLAPEKAAGWFLTQLPAGVLALYAGLVAATIVSTIDSAIQSVVVNLTHDVYKKLLNPEVDDRKLLRLSRILSVVVTAVAAIWAIAWPQALGWLIASYAYSASILLFPLFLGYLFRESNFLTHQGCIASMVAGLLCCGLGQWMGGMAFGVKLPYVAFGLTGSLIALLTVSALTRSQSVVPAGDVGG